MKPYFAGDLITMAMGDARKRKKGDQGTKKGTYKLQNDGTMITKEVNK
jgi:hypothetical protein